MRICVDSLWFRFAFAPVKLPNGSMNYETFVIAMDHQDNIWEEECQALKAKEPPEQGSHSKGAGGAELAAFQNSPSSWEKPLLCF